MYEFARAEAMDVDHGKAALDMRKKVQIPLHGKLGMMAPLHENLRPTERDRFLDFAVDFLMGNHVGVLVSFHAIEGAEFAINVANVGVIDVAINDVSDDFVSAAVVSLGLGELPAPIGKAAQFIERQRRETERLGRVDAM